MKDHQRGLRLARPLLGVVVATAVTALSASTAWAAGPTLSLTNDANQPGVFATATNVAKNVTYPDTVTYMVSITAPAAPGPNGLFPLIDSLGDSQHADLSSCNQQLDGVRLTANQNVTCTYTITLSGAQSSTFADTVTLVYSGAGLDRRQSTSTIDFPAMTLAKSSTTQFVGAIGQVVPYSYLVTNTGTTALTGITLSDNNTDAAPVCPSTTLALNGSMTCTAQHTVTAADLTGSSLDNVATASSNEAPDATAKYSIPVVPAAAGGSFVIGDLTYAANPPTVTFWGAQWWKLNSLSGGSGPAAFKGFEDQPAAPTCGQNWTTDPGNSTPPPVGPLPPYMAIIVSSTVTQSGSTISGDTEHVVVVKTNAGYQGNPGHAGTGSIVATLC